MPPNITESNINIPKWFTETNFMGIMVTIVTRNAFIILRSNNVPTFLFLLNCHQSRPGPSRPSTCCAAPGYFDNFTNECWLERFFFVIFPTNQQWKLKENWRKTNMKELFVEEVDELHSTPQDCTFIIGPHWQKIVWMIQIIGWSLEYGCCCACPIHKDFLVLLQESWKVRPSSWGG